MKITLLSSSNVLGYRSFYFTDLEVKGMLCSVFTEGQLRVPGLPLRTVDDQVCFWYNHQRILRALSFGLTTKTHLKTLMSKLPRPPPPAPYPPLPLVFKAL